MFNLQFSINVDSEIISGFDLGNISLSYNGITVSSSGKVPDQSLMVFITIVDMLHGINNLITNKHLKEFNLVCADSSFSILFKKLKNNEYQIVMDGKIICSITEEGLAREIYDSCYQTYIQYKGKMLDNDPMLEDIEEAIVSFRKN